MGREATMYLTERGVRVVGTDGWSWDAPFNTRLRSGPKIPIGMIWEGHKAGREIPYWQMEKLHNLEALPNHGFTVACFLKIANARRWTRCVALIDDWAARRRLNSQTPKNTSSSTGSKSRTATVSNKRAVAQASP